MPDGSSLPGQDWRPRWANSAQAGQVFKVANAPGTGPKTPRAASAQADAAGKSGEGGGRVRRAAPETPRVGTRKAGLGQPAGAPANGEQSGAVPAAQAQLDEAKRKASALMDAARNSYENEGFFKKHFGSDTPGSIAGGNLGDKIRQDGQPGDAGAVLDAALKGAGTPQERQEIAAGLVRSLSEGDGRKGVLVETAQTEGGRALLERAIAELPKGSDERTRAESALKAAELGKAEADRPRDVYPPGVVSPEEARLRATYGKIENDAGSAARTDDTIGRHIGGMYATDVTTMGRDEGKSGKFALQELDRTLASRSSPEERQNVARGAAEGFLAGMGDSESETAKRLHAAQTPEGRAFLERIRDTLPQGDATRARVEATLNAASLYNMPEKDLDPASRDEAIRQVRAAFDSPGYQDCRKSTRTALRDTLVGTSAGKTQNVAGLVKSDAFKNADVETRHRMLAAIGQPNHAGDEVFRKAVQDLAADPKLATPEQKAAAIQALDDFASRGSYNGDLFAGKGRPNADGQRAILENGKSLITSPAFQAATPEDRQAALAALDDHAKQPAAGADLADLMNTSGFKAADASERKRWIDGWNARTGDAVSQGGMALQTDRHQYNGDNVEFLATRDPKGDGRKVQVTATYTGKGGIRSSVPVGTYDVDTSKALNLTVAPDGKSFTLQDGGKAIPLDYSVKTENGVTTHSFGRSEMTVVAKPAVASTAAGEAGKTGGAQEQPAERTARTEAATAAATKAYSELNAWGNAENYPPELAGALKDARAKQDAALKAAYNGSAADYAQARAEADRAMLDVSATAVRNGGPMTQQVDGLAEQDARIEELRISTRTRPKPSGSSRKTGSAA